MSECISPLTFRRRGVLVTVPCGSCGFCLKQRSDEWFFRISKELEVSRSAYFITMTYQDSTIPVKSGVSTLVKDDLKKFMHRLRMQNGRCECCADWPRLKYYAVGEYGTQSGRPHYHVIAFNLKYEVVNNLCDTWGKGFVKVGTVTGASIRYVVDYVITKKKSNEEGSEKREEEFAFISKGVGEANIESVRAYHETSGNYFSVFEGRACRTPRYYADKVYNKFGRSIAVSKLRDITDTKRAGQESELGRKGYKSPVWEIDQRMRALNERILKRKSKKL